MALTCVRQLANSFPYVGKTVSEPLRVVGAPASIVISSWCVGYIVDGIYILAPDTRAGWRPKARPSMTGLPNKEHPREYTEREDRAQRQR
jgi:hypothetical protein